MASPVKELDVTDVIGNFGSWQRRIFVMCMQRGFLTAMHTLVLPLLAAKTPFQCNNYGDHNDSAEISGAHNHIQVYNASLGLSQCSRTDIVTNSTTSCSSWLYDTTNYKSTVITEWDLVCERSWMLPMTQTTYMLSMMINVFLFGLISDKVGRRPVLLVGATMFVFGAIATVFSPSLIWFNVFRVLTAGGAAAIQNTAYCNLMETIGPEYRMRVGIAYSYGWIAGLLLLPGIAYFIRDWRYLQLAIALPTVSLLIFFCLMPESARWLLTQKRDEDARVVLEKALKVNKQTVEDMNATMKGLRAKIEKDDRKDMPNLLDLVKTSQLRKNSFIMFYAFFVVSFLYYALSLGIADLGGNLYLNFFLLSAIELPCYPLAIVAMKLITRRNTTALFFMVAGIFCLLTLVAPREENGSSPWPLILLSTLGKMFVASSFMLAIIMSGEAFPTVLRTLGVSGCWAFARIGSAIAPFTSQLASVTAPYVPAVLSGVLALTAGGLILLLPSTIQDNNLADTLKEAKELSRNQKKLKMGKINEACELDDDSRK